MKLQNWQQPKGIQHCKQKEEYNNKSWGMRFPTIDILTSRRFSGIVFFLPLHKF